MSWLGRQQLGSVLDIYLQCVDSADTPSIPTNPPQLKVRFGTTVVLAAEMPVIEKSVRTGRFYYPLKLANQFTTGHYNFTCFYKVSTFHGFLNGTFEIIAGGDAGGQVLNMYFFDRPHADFVVYGTEFGSVYRGRNPQVT